VSRRSVASCEVSGSVRTLRSWLPFGACSLSIRAGLNRPPPVALVAEDRWRRTCDWHRRSAVVGLRSPSPPTLPGVHSRKRCRLLRSRRIPSPQSRSILVVLHHLDGFLRPEVAGLLHPAASHEVRRVSCSSTFRSPCCRSSLISERPGIPRGAVRTPRRIPPDCSRSTSLWPLPPCRSVLPARLRRQVPLPVPGLEASWVGESTSRLSSAVGSVVPSRPLPVAAHPILPWALFPFKALSPNRGHRALDPRVRSPAGLRRDRRCLTSSAPFRTRSHVSRPWSISSRRCSGCTRRPPDQAFAEANAAILADVWGLAPTIDCCFHSRRPEVVAVDPIPPQVRSLQSLSGAEVRAACARWCPGFPAHVSGRQHRPSWGS
jgi:hypothetical protein